MAKKNQYLSAKEQKHYSKLIAEKLESLGVKDTITMHPSGKQRRILALKEDGSGLDIDERGFVKTKLVDVLHARNLQRNMVRTLRKQPRAVVKAFLNVEAAPVEESSESVKVE